MFNRKRFRLSLLFLSPVLVIFFLIAFQHQLLTKNRPVKADILVIEGWLPAYCLERIPEVVDLKKYRVVFITSTAHFHPTLSKENCKEIGERLPVWLWVNGCLGVSSSGMKKIRSTTRTYTIKVFAYGTKAKGRFPNFFVSCGDSVLGNAFVTTTSKAYAFTCQTQVSPKAIYLFFNNDIISAGEDRNLAIDSISVNGVVLNKPSDFFLISNSTLNNNKYINYPFKSYSDLSAAYLKALGVKNRMVIADTFYYKRNKTLAMAKKMENELTKIGLRDSAINIVSIDGHSLRSYIDYRKASHHKRDIGIVSIHDVDPSMTEKKYLFHMIDEYFSLLVSALENLFSR